MQKQPEAQLEMQSTSTGDEQSGRSALSSPCSQAFGSAPLPKTSDEPTLDRDGPFLRQCFRQIRARCRKYIFCGSSFGSSGLFVILFGQFMSFTLAAAFAALATLRLDCKLSAPTLSITPVYLALATFAIPLYCARRREKAHLLAQQQSEKTDLNRQNATLPLTPQKSAMAIKSPVSIADEPGTPTQSTPSRGLISRTPRQSSQNSRNVSSEYNNDTNDKEMSTNRDEDEQNERRLRAFGRHSFLGLIPLSRPITVYVLLALADLYAQVFVIWAFRYTTITSVAVMDALAIPSAMVLSRFWLGRRYSSVHFVGVTACMIGVFLNIFQDYEEDVGKRHQIELENLDEEYPHKALGDLLGFLGGVLFGVSNTISEHLVRDVRTAGSEKIARLEYLTMLGILASLVCVTQTWFLEKDKVEIFVLSIHDEETCSRDKVLLLWAFFSACCFIGYVGTARFLQVSEAVFYNLSLLTGDFFCVGFQVFQEHMAPKLLFYPSLLLIIGGTLVYEMTTSPLAQQELHESGNGHGNEEEQDDSNESDGLVLAAASGQSDWV